MRCLPLGLAFLALVACPPSRIGDLAESKLEGVVSLGSPVARTTVSVYRVLPDATRGERLGTGETDELGHVSLRMPRHLENALACATGGFFTDLVSGSLVRTDEFELCAYLPAVGSSKNFAITPFSHLVNVEMQYLTLVYSLSLADAFTKSSIDLNGFLTCGSRDLDVTTSTPVDPSVEREQDQELTSEVLAGLLLGGLSAQAAVISESLGYSPGLRFTPVTLVQGLADDLLQNMTFDGVGTQGRIILEGYEFSPETFRFGETGFVRGFLEFLASEVNQTSVTAADTQDLMLCMSTALDPLFGVEGTALDLTPPVVSFLSPAPGATVRGTFDVVISADDPSGVESLVFGQGQDFLTDQQESQNGTAREVRATVDGNALSAGPLTVVVEATDLYGNTTTSSATFTLEPYVPGTLYGRVFLDTPVLHATIEVVDFTDGVRGAVLASQASDDGSFALPMPEHTGPVLIRASGTSAGYLDLATSQPVYFTGDDELLCFLSYDGQSGAVYQDLSVNALTTLATRLGLKYQAGGQDLVPAMTRAYGLFGKHLERTTNPNGVDIARTAVSNLSTGSSSDPPKSIFMGLAHVGLSRWGASAATSQGLARTALPSLDVLKLLERDLSSGVLSGRDEFGAPIYATPNQAVLVVTNTLRHDLAREISRWLASMPLPDGTLAANPTALRPSNFSVAGGFFDALALDTSELFSAFDPTVPVDATPPTLRFTSPAASSDVAGAVTITATASDDLGLYALQFAADQDWITGRSSSVSGTSGHLVGQLDATELPQGPLTISVVAMDLFGNTQQTSITVNVVTIPDGTIGGRVFLDTPVANVNVEALDFTGGVRGAVLASATSQDGTFSLQIPFAHDGAVLLRASGTTATYKNMALDLQQTFTTDDELTLVVNYGSSGDGKNLAGRSVNAVTTMATKFVTGKVALGMTIEAALSLAFQLLGKHLDRPGIDPYGLNSSTTTVSDFSGNPASDPSSSILLGLTHVGLSRWGAEVALAQNLARSALPPTAVLRLFLRDLEDFVLDGKDGSGTTIYATPNQAVALDPYTFKNALAQSIAVWLDNVPLRDATAGQNTTALRAANFATEQGFFDDLCMDDSVLFPPVRDHELIPFDRNPPVVTITYPTGNPLVAADFNVLAEAVDTSAIRSFSATILGASSASIGPDALAAIPDHIQQLVDVSTLADGSHTVRATAVDVLGNAGTRDATFVVDNTPPALSITVQGSVGSSASASVTGTFSDSVGPVTSLTFKVDGSVMATLPSPSSPFARSVAVPCDRTSVVEVIATNAAGHFTSRTGNVACDCKQPNLTINSSSYTKASELTATVNSSGTSVTYAPTTSATTLNWSSLVTLEKYFNRLDYLPSAGRTEVTNNLPSIAFTVDDTPASGAVYTNAADLVVEYSVTRTGGTGRIDSVRARRPLSAISAGTYRLPISYQSMAASLALATPQDTFEVTIHVTDAMGNTRSITKAFKLSLSSPPVWVGYCTVDSGVLNYNLQGDNFHTLFSGQTIVLQTSDFRYPLELPAGSLAPSSGVVVGPHPSDLLATVTNARRVSVKPGGQVNASSTSTSLCATRRHSKYIPGQPDCFVGATVPGLRAPTTPEAHYPDVLFDATLDSGTPAAWTARGEPLVYDTAFSVVTAFAPPSQVRPYALYRVSADTTYHTRQFVSEPDPFPTTTIVDYRGVTHYAFEGDVLTRENYWGYTDCTFTPCDPAYWTPPPYARKQTLELEAYPQTIQTTLGKHELAAYHESVEATVPTVYASSCTSDQNWIVSDN